jgi:hypothetical protein
LVDHVSGGLSLVVGRQVSGKQPIKSGGSGHKRKAKAAARYTDAAANGRTMVDDGSPRQLPFQGLEVKTYL